MKKIIKRLILAKKKIFFDEEYYLKKYPDVAASGIKAWKHYRKYGYSEGRFISQRDEKKHSSNNRATTIAVKANELVFRGIGHNIKPLRVIFNENKERGCVLVTDSLGKESLFGGVATAIIVAVTICKTYKLPLTIITRSKVARHADVIDLYKFFNISFDGDIKLYFDDGTENASLIEVHPDDIFMATSWWSAYSIRKTFPYKKFFYLAQEVETFFYPHGDQHYLCSTINNDENIYFIINHYLLYEYCNEKNVFRGEKIYFSPAFSKYYSMGALSKKNRKKRIFFYARPNNPRNLFSVGLDRIDAAVRLGIIDTNEWDIYFAGSQFNHDIILSNGYKVLQKGVLSLEEYRDFLSETDLAISLMYTPHPSYPPYDALLSGCVVLTNCCENKRAFDCSKNVILTELDEESFFINLDIALKQALDMSLRVKNYQEQTINTDWDDTLKNVLKFIGEKI